eukprot:13276937-Alexandrium_andersonii.AAC.1
MERSLAVQGGKRDMHEDESAEHCRRRRATWQTRLNETCLRAQSRTTDKRVAGQEGCCNTCVCWNHGTT